MHKFIKLISPLFVFIFLNTTTSCESNGNDIDKQAPLLAISIEETEVLPGEKISISLSLEKGEAVLNSLQIFESGKLVDPSKLSYSEKETDNPLLFEPEEAQLTLNLVLTAHEGYSTKTYDFELEDLSGLIARQSLSVSTYEPGAPILRDSSNLEGQIAYVEPNTYFSIFLSGEMIDGDRLKSLVFLQEGSPIAPNRIQYQNNGAFINATANPLNLTTEQSDGFGINYFILTDNVTASQTFEIELHSNLGKKDIVSFELKPIEPISINFTSKLLFNAESEGYGGINLMNGASVESNNPEAHLVDLGNNPALPTSLNWKQKIKGTNGTTIRIPSTEFYELGGFQAIETKNQPKYFYDKGTSLANNESDKLEIGDVLLVKKDTDYFIFQIDYIQVNEMDDFDQYDISIKH